MKNFLFLKHNYGRGFFDLFCSMMFLITSGNNGSLTGWIMMGCLAACGVFFIVMGCLHKEVIAEDVKSTDAKKQAGVNVS